MMLTKSVDDQDYVNDRTSHYKSNMIIGNSSDSVDNNNRHNGNKK